ncbi:hypothetical protein [Streptomyces sclerotialus]|uniref:hypothetical protein n=1 Tax=Streptomyces sclerotialus TaxID=1957 RepID=UPI000B04404A
MGEVRKGVAEPAAVEGALGFTDDDGIEAAPWVGECGHQPEGAGATLPRQCAGLADVEERAMGVDRVLMVLLGLDSIREASFPFRGPNHLTR